MRADGDMLQGSPFLALSRIGSCGSMDYRSAMHVKGQRTPQRQTSRLRLGMHRLVRNTFHEARVMISQR
jgi:hypothetical protein